MLNELKIIKLNKTCIISPSLKSIYKTTSTDSSGESAQWINVSSKSNIRVLLYSEKIYIMYYFNFIRNSLIFIRSVLSVMVSDYYSILD